MSANLVTVGPKAGFMMPTRIASALLKPFQKFLQLQAASGLSLMASALAAILLANSPAGDAFEAFWTTHLQIGIGSFVLNKSLRFWINDALMAVFFFVVGLEIKRELMIGELSSPRKAIFPVVAALGGMLVPVLVYLSLVGGQPDPSLFKGWGISTVTDIAFALGILTLLGNRVPLGLKIFLTALAIVDDIGAILLIALFYSPGLQWQYVMLMGLVLVFLFGLNRVQIRSPLAYAVPGLLLWLFTLNSGMHATVSGVLLAATIPSRSRINPCDFQDEAQALLVNFRGPESCAADVIMLTDENQQVSVPALETLCNEVQSPLQQLEHLLAPWSSYVVLPLFALVNAGVRLPGEALGGTLGNPITLGIVAGLLLGKQAGITLFAWLSVRLHLADLPGGVRWPQIYGAAILGGIGFTMSLFIATLAFQRPEQLASAKLGILGGSLLSAVLGSLVLMKVLPKSQVESNV